ncbi:cation:dicarboxylase symporter family transporter [Gilliamella sp. B2776]|uniref:cation:dicarboxylate symporter family transporter n=1 Tax=unclassified Gilliamella TaxID=2685620 RepID=UPI00226A6E37|nr:MULTISPECIES: cation:dicarboxylase symporter family transporter [unclassified Gilliamella]MCX8650375.1 cation:dicarboxylase symporter family transporter [Gilliamella sp. B2779]MCX8654652.1 cation:dicarboxylase symporter family transporter [Gilliamella sp. B2737]MCX8665289.1 cation:dicarboxylase symporter family transporter [Gilliamella sp. B2887]MCX8692148.1 cation:dicarboxylase symporter family transporter [Gilliamella sp. B2776]MCX8699419.1 cation:dicarboxylase symporter family transporte
MSDPIFQGTFFEKFLSITHYQTLIGIGLLLVCFLGVMKPLQDKKVNFSIRMLVGLILGAVLGLGIQSAAGFPDRSTLWMQETATWYGLFGRAFIAFIRMLVIPLIFVSIVKVIIDFSGKKNLPQIAFRGIFWLLFTTAIACIVGIVLANLFELGKISSTTIHQAQAKQYTNIIDTFVNLIPSNIIASMVKENIVGLVIFSALMGLAANRMEKKSPQPIILFKTFIEALYKIVMSIAMTIIKYMPYAVIALLARTIISNGIPAIVEVSGFVAAIYTATLIMLIVHVLIVMIHGISPFMYIKKAMGTWLLAFTSRSSVGTLPMTISTLTVRMGVNTGTANLVSSLGSTMGMNGCAGFFPALLAVMVAHMVGIDTNFQFYIMLVIVVVIGSIGIAGIPGTATVAATVVLSGMGMAEYFPLIGMVLAVDPIIDMARTLVNVSGSMTAAVATDREVGLMDMNTFYNPNITLENEQSDV